MQGTAGVFSTVNTKEKDRILTDQDRATENDKLEQMQSTVAVVRGVGDTIKIGWQIATLQSSCQVLVTVGGEEDTGSYNPWQNSWSVSPASRETG